MKTPKKLIEKETGRMIIHHLEMADTIWTRFRGLMFRRDLPDHYGLWIRPCNSIHTMWMRITIDVFFLDGEGKVLGVREQVKPWRIVLAPKGTKIVLETLAGTVQIRQGMNLQVVEKERVDDKP